MAPNSGSLTRLSEGVIPNFPWRISGCSPPPSVSISHKYRGVPLFRPLSPKAVGHSRGVPGGMSNPDRETRVLPAQDRWHLSRILPPPAFWASRLACTVRLLNRGCGCIPVKESYVQITLQSTSGVCKILKLSSWQCMAFGNESHIDITVTGRDQQDPRRS